MQRYAIFPTQYPDHVLPTIKRYLPSNFEATVVAQADDSTAILIAGEDDHGWTMADYVIPRLASGNYYVRAITESDALLLVPVA